MNKMELKTIDLIDLKRDYKRAERAYQTALMDDHMSKANAYKRAMVAISNIIYKRVV